jgi:putative aminopeptidase FrvX
MPLPPLLVELLLAHGAPGAEGDVHTIVRREAEALGAEVTVDALGGTVARAGGGRTVALVAHTDQVALGVTRIDDDGLLRVGPLGTWQPSAAIGQRFAIETGSGRVSAVGVRRGSGEPTWDDVRLDLGLSSATAAGELVSPGDAAVFDVAPLSLGGRRFTSPAIDNRAGVYVGLELLRRFAGEAAAWGVALVASVQEEGSHRTGAEATVSSLAPDLAIVLEASYASDAPYGYPAWGECPVGGGPSVFRGPVVHPSVSAGLISAAEAVGAAVSVETGTTTMTDGDDLFTSRGGLAVGVISTPVRYMHTAHELADLGDIEAMADIVERYVRTLASDVSFLR